MSFEEEIKQTRELSEYEKGIINILLTYYMIENRLSAFLGVYNLTMHQYNILRILRGAYPDCYANKEIKKRMLHKNADATRLIDRLCDKNLTRKSRCTSDRRRVEISITDKGLEILAQIDSKMSNIEEMLKNLNKSEVNKLNFLLEKARA